MQIKLIFHMNGKAQVEVVMECNIRARTRIDHIVWAPCATSTPVRKPLVPLNNTEVTDGSKKYYVMTPNAVCRGRTIETAEGRRPPEKRNKNVTKKKSNKNSRTLHRLEDDDDDDESEDEKTGSQTKKRLIIKLSSSQFNKRNVRKKKPKMETNPILNEQGKDMHDSVKPTKVSDSEIKKCHKNKNSIPLHETQNCKESLTSAEVKENLKSFNTSEENKITENIKNVTKQADNHRKLSYDICNNKAIGFPSHKRKNKNLKLSHVKRLKTELNSPFLPANVDTKKKPKLSNNEIKNGKTGRVADIIKHENLARLSVLHEIFSDSKERQFRDSLDLTASDHEELPIADLNGIKLLDKQKTSSTWKCPNLKQSKKSVLPSKIQASDNFELSRPKRLKKSPKEFWLPKSESIHDHSYNNNDDAETGKHIKVDQVVTSTEQSDEPEILGDCKVLTSSEVVSNGRPSDIVYVKTISELDFVENGLEDEKKKFFVATGWQFSKFKCCALKINAKCEASSRTKSSHFGGVILKGRLSMKIGDTEVKMKEGQMFYIPPSTDWRAINIGRIDCVLYYWVGKL